MENFTGMMKLKRKDLEDVNDDFSDFSLSSPARKMRRLDAELPPIIEEEEVEISPEFDQLMSENVASHGMRDNLKSVEIEDLPFGPENEEKAIVLFKPTNSPVVQPYCNYSVDPNLISSFKNQAFSRIHLDVARPYEDDEALKNRDSREADTCKAVIPWVPSQHQLDQRPAVQVSQDGLAEAMDSEETEAATMEIEDDGAPNAGQQANEYNFQYRINEGLQHQWQQQHCMIPQPPQNITTPLVWYR